MNCETCQGLIHDLIDGSITQRDEFTLNTHLKECLDCESVRQDLASIVGFCRTQRGQYDAPPNEQAMWLRIRNVIEAELPNRAAASPGPQRSFLSRLMPEYSSRQYSAPPCSCCDEPMNCDIDASTLTRRSSSAPGSSGVAPASNVAAERSSNRAT